MTDRDPAVADNLPEATDNAPVCFVMMPFGGKFKDWYADVFAPAISNAGMTPKRADDVYQTGSIVTQIWHLIQQSQIGLADLSDRNPNVMYELGLAHALGKPALLLTRDIEDVPFDLRHLRIIKYDLNSPKCTEKLRADITQAIQETQEAPLPDTVKALVPIAEARARSLPLAEGSPITATAQTRAATGRIGAEELQAMKLVKSYREQSYADDDIVAILSKRGVPPGWIRSEISLLRGQAETTSP